MSIPRATQGDTWQPSALARNFLADLYNERRAAAAQGRRLEKFAPATLRVEYRGSEDLDRWDVIGFTPGAALVSPSSNADEWEAQRGIPEAAEPEDVHCARWALAWDPLTTGQIGRVVAPAGVIEAPVNVIHESHTHADVIGLAGAKGRLRSGYHGAARILWKETGTGERWALLAMGPWSGYHLAATAVNDIDPDSAGPVTVQWGSQDGSTEQAHLDELASEKVDQGDGVFIEWDFANTRYRITGAEC